MHGGLPLYGHALHQQRDAAIMHIESENVHPAINLCAARLYLSDGGVVGHAGRVGAPIVRVVEGFLIRGDLVLTKDPVVTQFAHPFIKQVLLFDLKGEEGTCVWLLVSCSQSDNLFV